MTRKQKPSSWRDWLTFPKAFTYDIDAPLEDVVQAMGSLEKERGFFNPRSQDISLIPVGGEYQFRFRMRQQSSVMAQTEGVIWEDETGTHIEGEARLSQTNVIFYLFALLIGIPWAFMIARVGRLSFLGVLGILTVVSVAAIYNVYRLAQSRQQVIDEIEKGLDHLNLRAEKQKRSPSSMTQRLSTASESVWDEAISEQSHQQERDRR